MTFKPFNLLYDSGSEFVVVDPVTNQPNTFYLISASGATSENWYWGDYTPYPQLDSYSRNKLLWVNYLNKFVTQTGNGGPYLSSDGLSWVSASEANDSISIGGGMATAEDLNLLVAGRWYSGVSDNNTSSIAYSSDGIHWNIGTSSVVMNVQGVAYSPTLQTFVSVGVSASRATAAYSTNGTYFTVVSGSNIPSQSKIIDFTDVTWDGTGNQYVAVGRYKEPSADYYSCSIHTSTNGQTWTLKAVVPAPTGYSTWFTRVIAVSGSYLLLGDAAGGTGSILRSTNLTAWSYVQNLPTRNLYDIAYSPSLNKFVAVGEMSRYSGPIYSTDTINWYTGSFSPYAYDVLSNIAWSPILKQFVSLGNSPYKQTYRSYDGVKFFTKNESYTGSIGFTSTPAGTLYNTLLTPWTSSNASFEKDTQALTWVEFDLLVGPDPINQIYHFPTSSYGIVIDSASLSQFNTNLTDYMEDITINGVRYLYEVSQEEGNQYEKSNYGYYESLVTSVVTPSSVSTFSGSFKAAGRPYCIVYYGVYGNITSDTVAMVINLNEGVVEYSEDTTNRDNEGSYHLTGYSGNLKFINGPTMTSKDNGYWELAFKVGFNVPQQRSGSVKIT